MLVNQAAGNDVYVTIWFVLVKIYVMAYYVRSTNQHTSLIKNDDLQAQFPLIDIADAIYLFCVYRNINCCTLRA